MPNGAVTSAVLVHLRVEPAHFDWHWRERPALALLAWEALARDPLARLRRIQVESIGTTINFRPAAITNRDIAASALLIASPPVPPVLQDPQALQIRPRLPPRASQQRAPFASSRETRQPVANLMKRSCLFSVPVAERPTDRNALPRPPSGSVCGSKKPAGWVFR